MLLRQSENPDESLVHLNMANSQDDHDLPSHPTFTVDTHDDVFGSAPSSPTILPSTQPHAHPSDVPRLQQAHTTSGYREGLTLAKAQSIQSGFDEGFHLGATIGQTAGELVGLLEGIAGALSASDAPEHVAALPAAKELLGQARAELSAQRLFGSEYWEVSGMWKFEVLGGEGRVGPEARNGEGGDDGEVVVFEDVARSHPLIRKWVTIVEEQVKAWGIKRYSHGDARQAHLEERGVGSKTAAKGKTRAASHEEPSEGDGGTAKAPLKQWGDW